VSVTATKQLSDWLETLGLGQYAPPFAENDITFAILHDLTDQDLKELGVASPGHRRQLLRAIAELNGVEKGPPSADATRRPTRVSSSEDWSAEDWRPEKPIVPSRAPKGQPRPIPLLALAIRTALIGQLSTVRLT
jgi:hypothetical protein